MPNYDFIVSAVILSYNRCNEVLFTIRKLKDYQRTLPFILEIIVVDNASTDDTSKQVKEKHPDVTLITKEKNNGVAGWNEGFKIANGKYFLVLDDDSHIHSGLIDAVDRLQMQPDIGILALQIKDSELGLDPNLDPDEAWKDNDNLVGFIGCGAIIRKDLYSKIGGFAEWIYVYTHEFEYGIRCIDAGYRINFFGSGIVIHRVSVINRSVKRVRAFATRNEMLIVYKYFENHKWKYILRILINNLKFVRREGIFTGIYVLQGALKFLKFRHTLSFTPVSKLSQEFFADNFWSTKPPF